MGRAKGIIKWVLPPCALLGTVWVSLAIHNAAAEANPFLTAPSPSGTYTVNLTGRKERPFLIPNTVDYHALKVGEPFLASRHLHSAWDFMDLSFELGYPDHRWVSDNILQLYNERYFSDGEPDALVIVNRAGQIIKHLRVQSVDQFLLFDLQPGAETRLLNSRPRGDYKDFHVVGEFYNGRRFEGGKSLRLNKRLGGPFTYYIYISGDGATFEGS